MMTTDLHAHSMRLDALDELSAVYPQFAPKVTQDERGYFVDYPGREAMGPIPLSMFEIEPRLDDMDRMRVDRQILAVPPPQLFYDLDSRPGSDFARVQNDAAIELSDRHPDRIQVFCTLPMQDAAASTREIERLADADCVRGVQIGTNINGVDLDSREFDRVWAVLAEANLPVWVHPDQRSIAGSERLRSYYLSNLIGNPLESTIAMACLIFGGVLKRNPQLRFGFVHGGGYAPYQLGRWEHGWNCRPEPKSHIDTPPTEYFGQMYFDTLTHDAEALAFLGERPGGWQRVVLGTDYPFDMASSRPVDDVESLNLPDADRAAVLHGNAEIFLRSPTSIPTETAGL